LILLRLKLAPVLAASLMLSLTNGIPEITTNFVTQVFSNHPSGLGVSNIIGSGIFEFTVILGLAMMIGKSGTFVNAFLFLYHIVFYFFGVLILLLYVEETFTLWKVLDFSLSLYFLQGCYSLWNPPCLFHWTQIFSRLNCSKLS